MPEADAGPPIPVDDYLQFWVALDDADEANGCMHFIPGAHRWTLLKHRVRANGPQQLLAIENRERALGLGRAVSCPLKAGGATVHAHATPQFTPGNRTSDRLRRAYVYRFARSPFGVREHEAGVEHMRGNVGIP